MRVIDAGHSYELEMLDAIATAPLVFVKREGEMYPGNIGHHPGVNIQEVLRALIDRVQYLNSQIPSDHNARVLSCFRLALLELEIRAAHRHGLHEKDITQLDMENAPYCAVCGHWVCDGHIERSAEAPHA